MKVLVTGSAGFIGFHLSKRLLGRGDHVIGLDNVNSYYDVRLKEARLEQLREHPNFSFARLSLEDRDGIAKCFAENKPERVVNLAAQAGVRYSIENPHSYVDSNVVGFLNILEGCRHHGIQHLVYASSSSVYGANKEKPSSVKHNVDHPVSLYAATKKANELMAHCYSHLYEIPTTGLRFFTVYGPWGRPDMALFKFVQSILKDEPIDVYNHGQMERDFTYIDDIIEGVLRVLDRPPGAGAAAVSSSGITTSSAPYRLYNIGNHRPENLMKFIGVIEEALGRKAKINFLPMQPGDVVSSYADVSDLSRDAGFAPNTSIEVGIGRFVEWYLNYYKPRSSEAPAKAAK